MVVFVLYVSHPHVSCALTVLLVGIFVMSLMCFSVVTGLGLPVITVVVMVVVVAFIAMIIMTFFIAVIIMVSMSSTAFFSYVLDVISRGVLQVVLSVLELVWTVRSEYGESCDACRVHVERRHVS